jgi:hypothetical protein
MQAFSAIYTKVRGYRGHILLFAANSPYFEIPGKLNLSVRREFQHKTRKSPQDHS